MPPHLHPRSTATSTLFAGTLLASFVVVAIPHLVPCPRPHNRNHLNTEVQFQLDEQGKPIRRVQQKPVSKPNPDCVARDTPQNLQMVSENTKSSTARAVPNSLSSEAAMFKKLQQEAEVLKAEQGKDRECPVPKPRGVVGRWLGFEHEIEVEDVQKS